MATFESPVIETDAVESAIAAWRDILGDEHVVEGGRELENAEQTSLPADRGLLGIVRPSTTGEVQQCLKVANRYGIPVYPVSRGRNYGYGVRVAPCDDAVLMELKRMNRIVEFDDDLGYATIEPGVTFRQLHDFLTERDKRWVVKITGGHADGSVVGNRMERGVTVGSTPQTMTPTVDWEVVLPEGEVVRTGASRFGAKEPAAQAHLPGPNLEGIFEQSGMGVVTKMTVWLDPLPDDLRLFRFRVESHEDLIDLVDAFRPLVMDGAIQLPMFTNDYREAGERLDWRYPWQEVDGQVPLPESYLEGLPPWTGLGYIASGDASIGRRREKLLRRAVRGSGKQLLVSKPLTRTVARMLLPLVQFHDDWSELLNVAVEGAEQFFVPNNGNVPLAYWRKSGDFDCTDQLAQDRCGLLWYAPVLPARGEDVVEVEKAARRICLDHGFEPLVRVVFRTGRSLVYLLALVFDRDRPGSDEDAAACYRELVDEITRQKGYIPYRASPKGMKLMPGIEDDSTEVIRRLKKTMDPQDILSRGRYDMRHLWPVDGDGDQGDR